MVHVPVLPVLGLAGGWEWLIILVIALLLFGHKIPGMARNLGRGVSEFKQGLREGQDEGVKPSSSEKPEGKV